MTGTQEEAPAPKDRYAALRTHAQQVLRERDEAGLYPDGRIRDMAVYADHLRKGGNA
jgi:hypothetical protein